MRVGISGNSTPCSEAGMNMLRKMTDVRVEKLLRLGPAYHKFNRYGDYFIMYVHLSLGNDAISFLFNPYVARASRTRMNLY